MPFNPAKTYLRVRLIKPIPRKMVKIIPIPDPSVATTPTLGTTGQRMWTFQEDGKPNWIILTESKKALMMDQTKLKDYIESVKIEGRRLVDETETPIEIHREVYDTFHSKSEIENDPEESDASSADPKS